MEFFTAILFACWLDNGVPSCYHTVWPKVLTSKQQCLDTLSNGIAVVEQRGGKLLGYRCIDWVGQTDEEV